MMTCAAATRRSKPNWPPCKNNATKMNADAITIGGMMFELSELDDLPLTFNEKLWQDTVDHITVYADERVVFRFKDGKGSQNETMRQNKSRPKWKK